MTGSDVAVEARGISHRYGERWALRDVTLAIGRGEVVALLGPNGGGKSTLFRILATLQRPTSGAARVFGADVVRDASAVRRQLGVVFQHPSLDGKLTVWENLVHHGALHGWGAAEVRERAAELLGRFGVAERRDDLVERLSGGLARRVELAKCLLPRPRVLLLDEPSTGLDPGVRLEFMAELLALRADDGVSVVLTTHYLEEAERCDRVVIIDRGRVVAVDTPHALTARVGGDVVTLRGHDPRALGDAVEARFGIVPMYVNGAVRLEHTRGPALVGELVETFGDAVSSVTFGRPTLEDAFVRLTGHGLEDAGGDGPAA